MKRLTPKSRALTGGILLLSISLMTPALAQLVDETQVTPTVPSGTIGKSLDEQVGAGRGDSVTPQSSIYLIQRDPRVPSDVDDSFSSRSSLLHKVSGLA
ncbi:hypothetical protein N9129_00070 [Akkermansiaceae bacterium]|nr:hypothetical protein [bacterium]MDB4451589.1 hypothetical protein [Akkermansiaceae bacterium]